MSMRNTGDMLSNPRLVPTGQTVLHNCRPQKADKNITTNNVSKPAAAIPRDTNTAPSVQAGRATPVMILLKEVKGSRASVRVNEKPVIATAIIIKKSHLTDQSGSIYLNL